MRRNCEKIAEQGNRVIYIDSENQKEIYEILDNDVKLKEKFRHRIEQLKTGNENRDSYDKLSGYNNLWEIRLFKSSKGRNLENPVMLTPKSGHIDPPEVLVF